VRAQEHTFIVLITAETEVIAYNDRCVVFDQVPRGFVRSEVALPDYHVRIRNLESGELCFDEVREDCTSLNQIVTYFNAIGVYGMKTRSKVDEEVTSSAANVE
jgi:hypothetical protein